MENPATADNLIRIISSQMRVVTLGGIAVISHGLSRNTHDADIWVDPQQSTPRWCNALWPIIFKKNHFGPVQIGRWSPFAREDFESVIERDGVIRINGLDRPLDIFRAPNELPIEDFEEVWQRATPLEDGTRLPDVVDLLVTKQATGRDKDLQDIAFLEAKAEREYREKLPTASEPEAIRMLERFLTPNVAELALQHPSAKVRELALGFLHELADEGNPYARDIIAKLK